MKDTGMIIGCLVALVLLMFIEPLIVMWCWNAVVPAIFGLGTISFWQAFGLDLMCSCLFGTKHISGNKD